MKVRELMTSPVIRVRSDETVSVAARMLTHYNIGALPVCGTDGQLCGMVTDRDLVIRCLASGRSPETTRVRDVMSGNVRCVQPESDAGQAAAVMSRHQIRRLPVVENGRLKGMLSLGDLTRSGGEDNGVLGDICSGISTE